MNMDVVETVANPPMPDKKRLKKMFSWTDDTAVEK